MQTQVNISFYQSIDELPLNRFVDCLVDDNLKALVITGDPTNEQLYEAWGNISADYAERIGNHEFKLYKSLYRELELLRITLKQIHFIAARANEETGVEAGILRICYTQYFHNQLNKLLNTRCRLNYNDAKSYHAELDKCINRSKAIKIKIDLKLLSFEAIEKKNNARPGEKPTRQYFTSILVTLSDHAKYSLPETMKMGEYCERLKRFFEACENSKK